MSSWSVSCFVSQHTESLTAIALGRIVSGHIYLKALPYIFSYSIAGHACRFEMFGQELFVLFGQLLLDQRDPGYPNTIPGQSDKTEDREETREEKRLKISRKLHSSIIILTKIKHSKNFLEFISNSWYIHLTVMMEAQLR